MAEHSKLPWSFLLGDDNEPATDENSIGSICDAEETYIARIWADGVNPEADAAFIVRAVNNHERLVAALNAFVIAHKAATDNGCETTKRLMDAEANARALLAELGECDGR